jgi:type I restriction enzyme S subunit
MSFPRYSSYKGSGVQWQGEVPEHWGISSLKYIATIKTGYAFSSDDFVGEGIPVLRIGDITTKGGVDFSNARYLPSEYGVNYSDVLITKSDIVMAMTGATIGKVGWYLEEQPALLNQRVCVYRAQRQNSQPYLWYILNSDFYAEHISLAAVGGAQPNISDGELLRCGVPVPPLLEQIKIAAFLDRETAKIDALVAEQRRLMELLKEKRQAVISHAVTQGLNPRAPMKPSGNLWLGDVPAHWDVKRLKHVKATDKNAFVDGPFGSNLKSEHFVDNGDVYVIESNFATQGRIDTENLKTISNEHFATINRSETRGGDIIIAKIGAQYGKASILPILDKPAVVSGNSLKLTINQKSCDVKFVNWHLANLKELGVMEDIVNATAQPALSLGEMNNLPMLVPPLSEQESIVLFLDKKLIEFDTLTAEAQRAIDLLQERRTALISAAVTGKIDVRNAYAKEAA